MELGVGGSNPPCCTKKMAKENKLSIEIRDSTGKSAVKKIIAAGKIPSVFILSKDDLLLIKLTSKL